MSKISSKYVWILMVIVAFLIIAVSVFVFINLNNASAVEETKFITGEVKNYSVEVNVVNPITGVTKTYTNNTTLSENVFTFLKSLQAQNSGFSFTYSESEYGTLVTGVDGYIANSDNQEFWKFFVNNQPSDVGISDYILKGGDSIRWEIDHF